jgi:hypothetical protein
MKERVRDVMRYAGPRMLLRHPYLALMHLVDGKLPAPSLRKGKKQPEPVEAASKVG